MKRIVVLINKRTSFTRFMGHFFLKQIRIERVALRSLAEVFQSQGLLDKFNE